MAATGNTVGVPSLGFERKHIVTMCYRLQTWAVFCDCYQQCMNTMTDMTASWRSGPNVQRVAGHTAAKHQSMMTCAPNTKHVWSR